MMNVNDSETRKNKILELIIEAYVVTAVPVGSELIARKLRSTLSSATIRNVMGQLEEEGYLEQPHTSAGRVPTDRGYRFYVDAVMEKATLPAETLREILAMIQPPELDVDRLLDRAAIVLAELTELAAVVAAPTVRQSRVKQIELVPLGLPAPRDGGSDAPRQAGVRKILCVLVADEEMMTSHVVEIAEPMSREEAAALARFINTELVGLPFDGLLESLERRMLAETDSFYHYVKRSLNILQHALAGEPAARLVVEGASRVIARPEFARHPERTCELMKGLDAEEALLRQLREDVARGQVRVRIGREVQVPGLEGCSYVAAPFGINGTVIGGLAALGPKRMDYARLSALVEGLGRCVTAQLNQWDAHA